MNLHDKTVDPCNILTKYVLRPNVLSGFKVYLLLTA